MSLFLFNGRLWKEDEPGFPLLNRSFQYGDAFFETIKYAGGKPLFVQDHWQRLSFASALLRMENPFRDAEEMSERISQLAQEKDQRNARVKLHIWRDSAGYYRPEKNTAAYLISSEEWPDARYTIAETGTRLMYYTTHQKSPSVLSTVKSANALIYVLAAMEAKEQGFDDAILFNTCNSPIETSNSNLFLVQEGTIFTPPLSEACLDGVMRKNIIVLCRENGIGLQETALEKEMIEEADEVFITNVIRGIQHISAIGDRTFNTHVVSDKLVGLLNKALFD